MQRIRNVLADVLVGLVLILVAFWLLRRVLAVVVWGATLVMIVIAVAVVFRIASKLRG